MKKFLLLTLLPAVISLNAQELPETVFYKHLEGNINKNLYLSVNLIKAGDSLYGNYYHWYIEHEGSARPYFTGPQIPLSGKMTSPNEFELNEFGEKKSYFEGIFVNGSRMEGTWINKETGKELPFELYEKYPKGSMEFKAYRETDRKTLVVDSLSPNAELELLILQAINFPSGSVNDSVKKTIYEFYADDQSPADRADKVLQKTSHDFFKRYKEANKDLHQIGHSFDWVKIIAPEILFNEDYILSLGLINCAFTGGAHGLQVNKYFVIDLTSGSRIELEDVLKENYSGKLDSLLNARLRFKYNIPEAKSLTRAGFFMDTIPLTDNFYLNKSGLNFHYNSYEIAPYSWGHVDLLIPYRDLKSVLRENGILSRIVQK